MWRLFYRIAGSGPTGVLHEQPGLLKQHFNPQPDDCSSYNGGGKAFDQIKHRGFPCVSIPSISPDRQCFNCLLVRQKGSACFYPCIREICKDTINPKAPESLHFRVNGVIAGANLVIPHGPDMDFVA